MDFDGVSPRVRRVSHTVSQVTYRESLREIEACLGAVPDKLYHMGFRGPVARATLADANEKRDWRIYAAFAQGLIIEARRLYVDESLGIELEQTVYAYADVRILDVLIPEPGSIYLFDRAYVDFQRLYWLTQARAIFGTRAKRKLKWRRRHSHPVDRTTGLICDQTIVLTGTHSSHDYPVPLRRVSYRNPESGHKLDFLSNDFSLPALTIADWRYS